MERQTSEQLPSKEKLSDWLRRWYALKGELRFREAADELDRLREDLHRAESARVAILAENEHYKREAAEANQLLNSEWFQRVTYKQQLRAALDEIEKLRPAQPPLTWESFWQGVRESGWNPSPEELRQLLEAQQEREKGTGVPSTDLPPAGEQ